MASYVGLDDFVEYRVGTAATVAFGNASGEITDDGAFKHEEGAAGQDDIIWDMHQPKASVKSVYKGESLIANAQRSSYNGMPPVISLAGGVVGGTNLARSIATGYVNEMEIACGGVGEAVMVNYDIIGLKATPVTYTSGQVAAVIPTAPFTWQDAAVTIGTQALSCQDFSVKLENGLRHSSSLDVKTAGSERIPEEIVIGSEKVSASFTVRGLPAGINFTDDVPTLPITASIVIGNGYTTKTLTLRDLYIKPWGIEILKGDEIHDFKLECESRYNPLRSAATAALSIA